MTNTDVFVVDDELVRAVRAIADWYAAEKKRIALEAPQQQQPFEFRMAA